MPARKAAAATPSPAGEQPNVADARRELVLRLKRVEGQLRAVQRMIEEGNDCDPIAQQLAAARKALDKAFFELMACAIEHPGVLGGRRGRRAARAEADEDAGPARLRTRRVASGAKRRAADHCAQMRRRASSRQRHVAAPRGAGTQRGSVTDALRSARATASDNSVCRSLPGVRSASSCFQ